MNDPHVVALWYRVEHSDSVDYGKAQPFDRDETGFCIKIANKQVCFEFKDHYASEDAGRKAIEDYIRSWEFDAGLQGGPNYFKLKFVHAQIEDRNPPPPMPGVVVLRGQPLRVDVTLSKATLKVLPPCYPPPPSGLKIIPDVQTLYDRYMGYLQRREPLTTMAYFCLTILELSKGRARAAEMYGIELGVLDKIGHLSSEKGGQQARKASGKDNDLTAQDCRFLKEAIKAVIRRAAEKAHDPDGDLPEISLSNLPPV